MPSNKDKVASYLETDEVQALDKFCEEKDCSRSQGVVHLIRERLIEDEKVKDRVLVTQLHDERLKTLEDYALEYEVRITGNFRRNEKQDELIAELQEEVCKLKAEIKESTVHSLSDEQIASVTRRRVEEVYDWRMGVRKPRGKNILKALEPYEIVDGLWRKKKVSEHLKSVQQSVQHF